MQAGPANLPPEKILFAISGCQTDNQKFVSFNYVSLPGLREIMISFPRCNSPNVQNNLWGKPDVLRQPGPVLLGDAMVRDVHRHDVRDTGDDRYRPHLEVAGLLCFRKTLRMPNTKQKSRS